MTRLHLVTAEFARTDTAYLVDRSTGAMRALSAAELVRGTLAGGFGADYVCLTAADAQAKVAQVAGEIFRNN